MHELSLCQNVLDILEAEAVLQGFQRVQRVVLEIGELAGVEPDALRFGFSAVMRDTLAAHATLEILERPGEAWCNTCRCTMVVHSRCDACPRCGGYGLQVTGGTEMRIVELVVDG